MTNKELREQLAQYPDDIEIYIFQPSKGYWCRDSEGEVNKVIFRSDKLGDDILLKS